MDIVLSEIAQRYGLKVEFSQSKIVGKINGYNVSIEYIDNFYCVKFNVSNEDINILNNLKSDIYSAMPNLVYLKNPSVNSWGVSFEISDKEYVNYTIYGSQSYITTDIMLQILDYICKLFSGYGIQNICSNCCKYNLTNTYQITNETSSTIALLCDNCAVNFNKDSTNVKKRVLAIIGSSLAGLTVALLYTIIYGFGYFFYFSGLLMACACLITYNMIIKNYKVSDSIIASVITIVCCFIAQVAGCIAHAYVVFSEYLSITLSETINLYIQSLEEYSGIFFELMKNTLIFVLIALLVVIFNIIDTSKKTRNRLKMSGSIRRI